ncbi:MAG: FtsX-like permease family protein, partial [Longimicrobiales bacterium]
RSLHSLLSTEGGVQPEQVATLELTLADADYPTQEARRAFYVNVLDRLRSRPDVEAAAAINELPLRGVGSVRFLVYPEGRKPDDGDVRNMAQDLRITEDYFHAMGIPIFEGRAPRSRPDTLAPREVAISRSLAKLYWPGRSPLGQRLMVTDRTAFTVVGVVADVRPRSLESEPIPQAYYALLDVPYENAAIVVRGRVPATLLTGWLRQAVRAVAPHQAVYNVRTMEQVIAGAITPRRTSTALITAFGAVALVLATIGVYGVMSFAVARRTREIGIRMALGAHPTRVRTAVVREGLGLALVGVIIGLFGAWLLARVLAGLVYGVSPHDPIAFIAAPVVLLSVAALAALIPARRATRIDPMLAIRAE